VLCLHGYMQSAEVFRNRIGSIRKGLKSQAEFVFVDAPYLAEADEQAARDAGGRSWFASAPLPRSASKRTSRNGTRRWQWTDDAAGARPATATRYKGWDRAESAIAHALAVHAPVHGILGFSQGACAAALYAGRCTRNPGLPSTPWLVLIGGFLPRDKSWAHEVREAGIAAASLHVFGAADTLVDPSRSRELAECFAGALTHEHPGAHLVPTCSGDFRALMRAFLDSVAPCVV